ncbi:hypothetical protein [Brevibacterium permense]|uniref:hypothetical protein n=1 Tax=Brevibacterium permense TaxID=234834 RepID=UPI0021D3816A|nr:hypothetical protein [Brevibacterium permense]
MLLVDDVTKIGLDDASSWAISPIEVRVGNYAALDRKGIIVRYLDLSMLEVSIPRAWFGHSHDAADRQRANSHGN